MPLQTFLPCLFCLTADLVLSVAIHVRHTPCTLTQRTASCSGSQLSSVPKDLPGNTEELQLNNNHITLLKNASLSNYLELRVLSLANNRLDTIETNVFFYTHHVENLNFAENNLFAGYEQLADALSHLSQLKVLDLSGNGLTEDMASLMLQNMSSLEILSLSRNNMLRLDQAIFSSLSQLKELYLERNQLFDIDEGAFDNLQKLLRLNVAFNNLPCLVGFQLTQLVLLNASHNAIEWFISNQDINDTFHLETLDLRDNRLLFFPFLPTHSHLRNLLLSDNQVSFYQHLANNSSSNWTTSVQFFNLNTNMSNITVELWDETLHGDISSIDLLDLTGNQVRYFPPGFLSKMPNLSRLILGRNCLESLNFASGELPAFLQELDVSNNHLTILQAKPRYVNMLENLTHLNLSQNDIQRLPSQLFSTLPSLAVVDLSHNKVVICSSEERRTSVEHTDCVIWKNIRSLRQLYLRDCGLAQIPAMAFEGTPLTHLELSRNRDIVIRQESIIGIKESLKHLGLGSTNFKNFDFNQFSNLCSLDISANSISHLPDSILSLGLRRLDLRDNLLPTIPMRHAQTLSGSLHNIFLGGNPFNCCQSAWLQMFGDVKAVTIEDLATLTCSDDYGTWKLHLPQMHSCESSSEEPTWWYVLLFLPMCLSLLGISIIFFLTFRNSHLPQEIKRRCWKPTSY